MKILFFGLGVLVLALAAPPLAPPGDPYLAFPWRAVRMGALPETRSVMRPTVTSLETFRLVLRSATNLAQVLTQCGLPAYECSYALISDEPHVPLYPKGRLYRYNLHGGHVYVWTNNPDGTIALAIYRSTAGTGELLHEST